MKLQILNDENEVVRERYMSGGSFMVLFDNGSIPGYDKDDLEYIRFDDKHVLRQGYQRVASELKGKYSQYLSAVYPAIIAFVVDYDWEPSEKASKNSTWKIDIQRAPLWMRLLTDYEYMVKMRQHWLDKWSEAQINAAIMSQLLRINPSDGSILKYSEDLNSKLVATFGTGYLEPQTVIPDLLEEHVSLREFRRADGQVTMEELEPAGATADTPVEEQEEADAEKTCGMCHFWDAIGAGVGVCSAGRVDGKVADTHPACADFNPEAMDEDDEDGDDHDDAA